MNTGIYHISFASHSELMFRSNADLIKGFNCMAEAASKCDSRLLADAFMCSHSHQALRSEDPREVFRDFRNRYTRYFNSKYHRSGKLGDDLPFIDEMRGAKRIIVGICYVIRQGLHHGLSATPFGYPHCSARAYFAKELGYDNVKRLIDDRKRYLFLTRDSPIPPEWRMDENGLLLREDVLDTTYVENLFVTPRNYLYHMNRLTDEKWLNDQAEADGEGSFTLSELEVSMPGFDIEAILKNERGIIDNRAMSDLELCELVDGLYLPKYFKKNPEETSIYLVPEKKRIEIANQLQHDLRYRPNTISSKNEKYATDAQIRRCLLL